MSNPVFNSAQSGRDVNVTPLNQLNDVDFNNSSQGLNTFDLSYQNLLTARYGEITPFFYQNCIGRDRMQLYSAHELRTYTLSSPLLSSLRMRKSYVSVPYKAMMPNTWDLLFVNPQKGDDVPDDAYCYCDLLKLFVNCCKDFDPSLFDSSTLGDRFVKIFNTFSILYLLTSRGSLLSYLGISSYSLDPYVDSPNSQDSFDVNIDFFFDRFCLLIADALKSSKDESVLSFVDDNSEFPLMYLGKSSSLRDVVDFLYTLFVHPEYSILVGSSFEDTFAPIVDHLSSYIFNLADAVNNIMDRSFVVNLYKVIAYQMSCAQFFTNPSIDNIYSSSLWLSNMRALQPIDTVDPYFYYNGVKVFYDVFSAKRLELVESNFNNDSTRYFWINLFSFRRSLRYGDYFTGSRLQPLAVGDVNVPVVGDNVSIIDINKNLHLQRFLNAVNRSFSNLKDYSKSIFGYSPQAVDPQPNFISSETIFVGSNEIDNTAESQGTVNMNLVAQQSHYAFDVNITDPSVIIGFVTFECTGSYPRMTERDNFHITRFDMFNPFLQHIGDQQIYFKELFSYRNAVDTPFSYQMRYAEYKFKCNQMHGGFVYNLPSWSFDVNLRSDHLDSDAIRSYPLEFDKYYKSLSYGSLAGYYHFQISFVNNLLSNRAMDYKPTLMG